LRNAIRYAGPAGPIEIAAHRERDKIFLSVKKGVKMIGS